MESSLEPLLPLFERERAAGRAIALGELVATTGSTYRKAGAMMLIAASGEYAGLLSGGCLEGDLGQYARTVIETGECREVNYDTRGGDDLLWGLGLGCEGALRILLVRVGPDSNWQPLSYLAGCLAQYQPAAVGIVVESERADLPVGSLALPRDARAAGGQLPLTEVNCQSPLTEAKALRQPPVDQALDQAAHSGEPRLLAMGAPRCTLFFLPLSLPPKLLLLGAGPDAAPVVELAVRLNWRVTLLDHRPAYADPTHFPTAERVVLAAPETLLDAVETGTFAAAVVMSHHLPSDLKYLRALAATKIDYIGLLGPVNRRERLLAELGGAADKLQQRLHSPVGLQLGGRAPESVALAIIAEIHAFLHTGTGHGQRQEAKSA